MKVMKEIKKKAVIIGLVFLLLILLIIGISYALLRQNILAESGKIIYKAGDLEVSLEEDSTTSLSLENAAPIEDTDGKAQTKAYRFTIHNQGTQDLTYEIWLDNDVEAAVNCDSEKGSTCELLNDEDIKYELKSSSDNSSNNLVNRNLTTGIIPGSSSITYELRLWLDINADNTAMGKYFFGKIRLEVSQYVPKLVNPILDSGMIAVTYNGSSWVKADTSRD